MLNLVETSGKEKKGESRLGTTLVIGKMLGVYGSLNGSYPIKPNAPITPKTSNPKTMIINT